MTTVPNIFVPATGVKSSEVNENFSTVTGAITDVNSRVDAIVGTTGTGVGFGDYDASYNIPDNLNYYDIVTATVGANGTYSVIASTHRTGTTGFQGRIEVNGSAVTTTQSMAAVSGTAANNATFICGYVGTLTANDVVSLGATTSNSGPTTVINSHITVIRLGD